MRFFCHFGLSTFSNAYLVAPDDDGEAVLIDPGVFDETILRIVEGNGLDVRHILVTHDHQAHTSGIGTVLKIYDAQVYAHEAAKLEWPTVGLKDGQGLALGGVEVSVIATPGHTPASVVYRVGRWLFTGDTLFAGSIGSTQDPLSHSLLLSSIKERLLPLDGDLMIFPGHGPPSKIAIERELNPELDEDALVDFDGEV